MAETAPGCTAGCLVRVRAQAWKAEGQGSTGRTGALRGPRASVSRAALACVRSYGAQKPVQDEQRQEEGEQVEQGEAVDPATRES